MSQSADGSESDCYETEYGPKETWLEERRNPPMGLKAISTVVGTASSSLPVGLSQSPEGSERDLYVAQPPRPGGWRHDVEIPRRA